MSWSRSSCRVMVTIDKEPATQKGDGLQLIEKTQNRLKSLEHVRQKRFRYKSRAGFPQGDGESKLALTHKLVDH